MVPGLGLARLLSERVFAFNIARRLIVGCGFTLEGALALDSL